MSRFAVGDRVVLKVKGIETDADIGQTGTVLEAKTIPWVRFDLPTGFGGEPVESDPPGWKAGHMDCPPEDHMELVADEDLRRANAPVAPFGLTKRELFAAMAMQGMAADPNMGEATSEEVAKVSVEWADALLDELAKVQP